MIGPFRRSPKQGQISRAAGERGGRHREIWARNHAPTRPVLRFGRSSALPAEGSSQQQPACRARRKYRQQGTRGGHVALSSSSRAWCDVVVR